MQPYLGRDILRLPSSAISFTPDEETLQKLFEERAKKREAAGNEGRRPGMGRGMAGQGNRSEFTGRAGNNIKQIWFLDESDNLDMLIVRLGIDDGKYYEIIGGRDVEEGMQVITSSKTEKLQTKSERRMGPPRGMGGPF
ncbi:MAG: hypothetical protein SCALA702_30950 [Melioribacteraceae bacterium]|nr:MAG: hypothetical protein SCALA702_30950 [Melioribacteraceae bacterium]